MRAANSWLGPDGQCASIAGSGGVFCEKGLRGPVAADPQGDSYVQQLTCEEDRPFSRYLLNRAGRDFAAADEQKPERPLRLQDKSRPLTELACGRAGAAVASWARLPHSKLHRVLTKEDDYGNLCRAGEVHRSGTPQREGVTEASRCLQRNGEDVQSDCEGHRVDTG